MLRFCIGSIGTHRKFFLPFGRTDRFPFQRSVKFSFTDRVFYAPAEHGGQLSLKGIENYGEEDSVLFYAE